jgi:hypothetical protein
MSDTSTLPRTIPVIDPCAVLTLDHAREVLDLAENTLGREVRLGRLRVTKRGGRYYVLGEWLLQWLRDGEVKRRKPATAKSST